MEATGHIQILLRDRRRILSVRRANVRHEVWLVDLRRLPGNKPSLSTFLSPFYDEKIPFHVSKKRFRSKKISKKGKINTSRFFFSAFERVPKLYLNVEESEAKRQWLKIGLRKCIVKRERDIEMLMIFVYLRHLVRKASSLFMRYVEHGGPRMYAEWNSHKFLVINAYKFVQTRCFSYIYYHISSSVIRPLKFLFHSCEICNTVSL